MSRSAVPSQAQQELLLNCMEEKQWLVKGYARTSHARDRTRAAWQEIAKKLNSDGRGCLKTWQQWSKYWKDKKSATKKRYSKMRWARQQTGAGTISEIILSDIEERIIAVMGGEQFAVGDRELDINPFHEEAAAPVLETAYTVLNETNIEPAASCTPAESVLQLDNTGVPGTSTSSVHIAPPSVISSPRRRRVTPRRRLLRRTPPSQSFSPMASLTERFLALEEQRIDIEHTRSQNQQELLGVLRTLSGAWTRQNQLLEQLINGLLNFSE